METPGGLVLEQPHEILQDCKLQNGKWQQSVHRGPVFLEVFFCNANGYKRYQTDANGLKRRRSV